MTNEPDVTNLLSFLAISIRGSASSIQVLDILPASLRRRMVWNTLPSALRIVDICEIDWVVISRMGSCGTEQKGKGANNSSLHPECLKRLMNSC